MIDSSTLVFQEVQPTDREMLTAFFLDNNVPKITDTFTAFPLTAETAASITDPEHKDKYYLLYLGHHIVGFSMLRGFDEGYAIPSFGIMIDHAYHNMGLGKHLLALTIDQAKKIGCEKVRLSVYGSNDSGRKIYETIGFHEIDRSPILRNNVSDVKIIMIKDLQ